jgi:hypothetical protein
VKREKKVGEMGITSLFTLVRLSIHAQHIPIGFPRLCHLHVWQKQFHVAVRRPRQTHRWHRLVSIPIYWLFGANPIIVKGSANTVWLPGSILRVLPALEE